MACYVTACLSEAYCMTANLSASAENGTLLSMALCQHIYRATVHVPHGAQLRLADRL